MTDISFDIILPSCGRESLNAAINSVKQQDFNDWHLWIVCEGFGRKDLIYEIHLGVHGKVIEWPYRHEDSGTWARNEAIKCGNQPWIAYIDDDDVWLPHHLSTLSSLIQSSPNATMARTAGQSFKWKHKSPRSKQLIRKLGAVNSTDVLTVGMAHTRELFNLTAGWQPCDNHDKLLWNEMLAKGGSSVTSDIVTFEFER